MAINLNFNYLSILLFTIIIGIILILLLLKLTNFKKYLLKNDNNSYTILKLPSVIHLLFLIILKLFITKKKKLNNNNIINKIKYEYKNQIIQKKHVLQYCKVCEFDNENNNKDNNKDNNENIEVPLTYPQLLGFRMQLLLFLDKEFPFQAMGLVHMNNTVKQYKKILTGSKVNIVVRNDEKLTIHPKGYCFDVICEIYSADEKNPTLLWSSISTYLTRKTHKSDTQFNYESLMKESDTIDLKDVNEPWKLKGDLGRRYAAVSEDYNPIHITAISASLFGFTKGCIAHGLWTSSKTIGVLSTVNPKILSTDKLQENNSYIEYYVEYKMPIFLPNSVTLTGKQENDQKYIVQVVSTKDKSKPHMKGYLQVIKSK